MTSWIKSCFQFLAVTIGTPEEAFFQFLDYNWIVFTGGTWVVAEERHLHSFSHSGCIIPLNRPAFTRGTWVVLIFRAEHNTSIHFPHSRCNLPPLISSVVNLLKVKCTTSCASMISQNLIYRTLHRQLP